MGEHAEPVADFDVSVPLTMVKVGNSPLHHGALGAVRSLGRVGVPVYALVEDRYTPTAVSRYLSERIISPSTGFESEEFLVQRLLDAGRRIGRPSVAIGTDDEAAVLLATHAVELAPWFLLPQVEPSVSRRLASKQSLREICIGHGIRTPQAAFVTSPEQLAEFLERARFPVVSKSVAPWARLHHSSVRDPKVLYSASELLEAARGWGPVWSVTLQEYLPPEFCEDWSFQAYFDRNGTPLVSFTGRKYRTWPPYAGPTSFARAVGNKWLSDLAIEFCQRIRYRGSVDMDWRYDRRDDTYYLLDCNPRIGAQFRLFETDSGIDVARAMHLDLTGRRVPVGSQVDGRRFVVEHNDARAVLAYRRRGDAPEAVVHPRGHIEFSVLAWDDPLPVVAFAARLLARKVERFTRRGDAARSA